MQQKQHHKKASTWNIAIQSGLWIMDDYKWNTIWKRNFLPDFPVFFYPSSAPKSWTKNCDLKKLPTNFTVKNKGEMPAISKQFPTLKKCSESQEND